jgi:hypothetical protein
MKIVFLPIDNRPVCYQLPEMISAVNKQVRLVLPPKALLGDLTEYANVNGLFEWLENAIVDAGAVILSLDTIAYGGLIPSRRSNDSFERVKARVEDLVEILKHSTAKVYAFSSIMRISNNNINEEEKEYWSDYGEQIFRYSYDTDKFGEAQTDVPQDVIEDYLATRKRNFEINKLYLKYQKAGVFDTLIFSKDDCAEYGLNVKEARELEEMGGFTKTGADEIPLSLMARALRTYINIHPIFMEPADKNLISNYEDVSVEKSVIGQLELAGCNITDEKNADVILYVNNFKSSQGEIVMKRGTELFEGEWIEPNIPYAVADVRLANGADNNLVSKLMDSGFSDKFLGYAGWNTTANTLGSLICAVKYIWNAKRKNMYDDLAFRRLEFVRFSDDWAYQANVRQRLKKTDENELKILMKELEIVLGNVFNSKID